MGRNETELQEINVWDTQNLDFRPLKKIYICVNLMKGIVFDFKSNISRAY